MGNAKENIETAYKWAFANRPKVNGFPFLAEVLKQAGVTSYTYNLPSCQCIYVTKGGCVASQMDSLISGTSDVPRFDREAFLKNVGFYRNEYSKKLFRKISKYPDRAILI